MGVESKNIGKHGENLAAHYLKKLGMKLVCKNYRTRYGEIDLIAWDKDVLVFIEVKSYSNKSFYPPSFSIDRKKRNCLIISAKEYMQKHNIESINCRFDVITLFKNSKSVGYKTEHYKNAFDADNF